MTDDDWVRDAASGSKIEVAMRTAAGSDRPPPAHKRVELRDGVPTTVLSDGYVELLDRGKALFRRRPRLYSDLLLQRCVLQVAFFAKTPERASTLRNVAITDTQVEHLTLEGTFLDGITISNVEHADVLFIRGARFRHVRFAGRFGALSIQPVPVFGDEQRWQTALEDFYTNIDWALDITDATFDELDIRPGAIPPALIRPATVGLG